MLQSQCNLRAGLQATRPAVRVVPPSFLLHHQQPCKSRTSPITHATRDVNFAYQQDIQTKLKPGDFADRMDNKGGHLAAAADWQGVVRLFGELGENTDRNIGLVGDMLVQLQRLAPAADAAGRLPAQDAALLAAGITNMCAVLLDNITRVNNKLLTNIVWALALLPDPAKLVKTPAAAAARTRAVAGFGAAVITRMPKLTAEELFHVAAALALLGFKPPRTLTRERSPKPSTAQGSNPGPGSDMKFGTLLEKRSSKVMQYLSPKSIADAGFVMSRLVTPGDVSAEWLDLYQKISKQHLPTMQPEAVVYAGYALARHGFKPSNSWQKAYIAAVQEIAKTLSGEEFPMVLFTLARWQQQRMQQQQQQQRMQQQQQQQQQQQDYGEYADEEMDQQWSAGSSSSVQGTGPVVPQTLIDDLLFASHTNRALRDLPLGQITVMVKAVTELPVTAHPLWVQRLWPLINSKIDAAIASASGTAAAAGSIGSTAELASDLAALLTAIPRLNPSPTLPPDFIEGLVGNLGLGLQQLKPVELSGVWGALQQLKHVPDMIFQRQLQAAVLQAVPNAAAKDLAVLVQLGLAIGLNPSSSSSSSSNVQGLLAADAFCQQLLGAFVQEVQRQVGVVAGQRPPPSSSAAALPAAARLAAQQQQQLQQLLDSSTATGLWQLPQHLLACVRALHAAAAKHSGGSMSSSSSSSTVTVLQSAKPQLQQLWLDSTVRLASVMPTEPLLVMLGFVLDLPEEDMVLLGLTSSSSSRSSKQGALAAALQSGVYQHLSTTVPATSGRGKAGVTSSAGVTRGSGDTKNLLENFSVEDFLELLVIIGDTGLAHAAPHELLDGASEALHGALAPKGPAYGFAVSAEAAEELVRELMSGFNYSLPSKVKARYKKWLEESGLPIPEELSMRRKTTTASSSSKKQQQQQQQQQQQDPQYVPSAWPPAGSPSLVEAVLAEQQADPEWMGSIELAQAEEKARKTAAAVAADVESAAAAAVAPSAPPMSAAPVVQDGVVRSSRRTTR